MSIQHTAGAPDDDSLFVFACLPSFSCSICAPLDVPQDQIEAYAMKTKPPARGKEWVVVNKAELGMGQPTPNPCNWEPKARQHWFLICE
jgi:hypothetical protein